MGRSLHARFKRWDGIEPDTNGEMQKVGSGQQDAQVAEDSMACVVPLWERLEKYKKAFLARSLEATVSVSVSYYPTGLFTLQHSTSNHFSKKTNTFSTLSKCLPVAAHLAPAPAAAINAPARAAATKLPSQCENPLPSARHWEATTGRTSTGPSRSDEGPCSPTVNSSQVFVICHISGLGGREWLFLCCWNLSVLECKELGL
ncbi:hypothetical protein E4U52_006940 [Claviceps spartinae]|nr:hypothetical protein E4U52_006940 [Claviceps spartinae]